METNLEWNQAHKSFESWVTFMISLTSSLSCVCVLFSQSLLIFYPGSICADKNQMMCNIDIHCPIGSP